MKKHISIVIECKELPWYRCAGPCDICGCETQGFIKRDGIFRCASCGMRYASFLRLGRYINIERDPE